MTKLSAAPKVLHMEIRAGRLYAVNNSSHPGIDTPEPYLCLNIGGTPRFIFAPGLANSGDGPHDTGAWMDHVQWAWALRADQVLGPWSEHRPPSRTANTRTTTIKAATHTTRVTTSNDPHDGYTTWFETTTTNPYFTKTLMRYLGADRPEAERHSGIGTPESE